MMKLKKEMSYEEIFKILNKNGFKFGREYFEGENKKYEYYESLPNHSCWIYCPKAGMSFGYSPNISVDEFVKEFNVCSYMYF